MHHPSAPVHARPWRARPDSARPWRARPDSARPGPARPDSARPWRALVLSLLTVVGALTVLHAPATAAGAATVPALSRCQAGNAPDTSETTFHPGTKTQVTYPSAGTDPDNGLFPGDVV